MLTLYEHPFALYCQKVVIALNEQGVAYDVLEEQRDFDRAELAQLWPPASIPVLRDGDHVIGESSIIIEHIAGARLVPSLEARTWDRLCDKYVSDAVQAIVADTIEERFDRRAVAQAQSRLDMAYGMLETQLDANEFLAGETFTIADCAAAPGLFYALAIHPWDEGTHPRLTRYYRALAQRPSVARVIADARPYRHLFPLPWPPDDVDNRPGKDHSVHFRVLPASRRRIGRGCKVGGRGGREDRGVSGVRHAVVWLSRGWCCRCFHPERVTCVRGGRQRPDRVRASTRYRPHARADQPGRVERNRHAGSSRR